MDAFGACDRPDARTSAEDSERTGIDGYRRHSSKGRCNQNTFAVFADEFGQQAADKYAEAESGRLLVPLSLSLFVLSEYHD